jgi:hypothetical protein
MLKQTSISALVFVASFQPVVAFETVAQLKGIAVVADGDGVLFDQVEVRLQVIPVFRHFHPNADWERLFDFGFLGGAGTCSHDRGT